MEWGMEEGNQGQRQNEKEEGKQSGKVGGESGGHLPSLRIRQRRERKEEDKNHFNSTVCDNVPLLMHCYHWLVPPLWMK